MSKSSIELIVTGIKDTRVLEEACFAHAQNHLNCIQCGMREIRQKHSGEEYDPKDTLLDRIKCPQTGAGAFQAVLDVLTKRKSSIRIPERVFIEEQVPNVYTRYRDLDKNGDPDPHWVHEARPGVESLYYRPLDPKKERLPPPPPPLVEEEDIPPPLIDVQEEEEIVVNVLFHLTEAMRLVPNVTDYLLAIAGVPDRATLFDTIVEHDYYLPPRIKLASKVAQKYIKNQ